MARPTTEPSADFLPLAAGGEMAARIRERDWADTPLGPIERWPRALKNALGLLLPSTFPMFVWWGEERIILYNDAYALLIGDKHPGHLGARAHEEWAGIWDVIGPLADAVLVEGRAIGSDNLPLLLFRRGYLEETWFGYAYSPVLEEDGTIAGLFCACHETTAEVLRARRLELLRGLAAASGGATEEEAAANAIGALERGSGDLPFALLYLRDGDEAKLAAAAGRVARALRPERLALRADGGPWRLAGLAAGRLERVEGLRSIVPPSAQTPTPSPDAACILPIGPAPDAAPTAFLVLGISPLRSFDQEYESFFHLVCSQVATHLAAARTRATERERLEALRAWAERSDRDRAQLEALLLSVSEGVLVVDMEGRPVLVNEAQALLAGYDSAAELERNAARFEELLEIRDLDGRVLAPAEWPLARILRGETIAGIELYARRRDLEHEGIYAFSGAPVRDAAGVQTLAVLITRDVSAIKRAEQAIREREAHFRTLVDTAPAMLWITDEAGDCTYLSKQWYEYTGSGPDEDLGLGWLEKVHPEDREASRRIFRDAHERQVPFSLDYRIRRRDGLYRWAIDSGNPRFDPAGRFRGFVGTVLDVSERKRVEAALQESEALFRQMANSLPLLTWIADASGAISWFNQRTYEFTGATYELLAHGGWPRFVHPDHVERVKAKLRQTIESGEPYEDTFAIRGSAGSWRWFLGRAVPLRNAEGRIVRWFGSNTDVTDEMRAREELALALQTRDEFLSIASHELKTPISSLKLRAQLVKRMIEREGERALDPAWVTRLAEETDRQADRLTRLIDDMLDIARVRTGRLSMERAPLALDRLVREVVERMQPGLESAGTPVEITALEPIEGCWDRLRVEQVLNNLLTNAQRYGERRPVDLRLERRGELAHLVVRDRGVGVSAENRQLIFERFERGDTSAPAGGLGIGLFIAREIVEAHGGRIWVESEGVGRGAAFHVELPLGDGGQA
ncbi:PAS domain S-box protein [Vulgatibacter sp.]|uniref:PAS domain S-box protein n=1 Tax=Vulgatibacter sp. TaxID=1971226 RepID=UPI0035674E34